MVDVIKNLDISVLTDILIRIVPALLCITLHELAHGYVAYRLGDNTAKDMGRLTLNPIKHIDIFGLAMMVFFRFGWAKPVPVNMRNFQNPKRGMALTALAGPVTNILITAVMLVIYGALYALFPPNGGAMAMLAELILTTAWLSTALAIFNIIPIPPLDGSKVLFSFLSDAAYAKLMVIERYGMIILMIVLSTKVLSPALSTATEWVFDKLFYLSEWTFRLVNRIAG